jgi:GNAT superfamily N-acetyltransferase
LGAKAVIIEYLEDRKELLPELAELHFAEWGRFRPGQSVEDRIDGLERCSGKATIPSTVVATDGRELIGSAMLVTHDMSTRKDLSPWLAGVFVKPSYRKSGIATKLIERIEQEAAALETPVLFLYTDKESEFYSRRGWKPAERCEYKGVHVTIMTKELSPNKSLQRTFDPQPIFLAQNGPRLKRR